MKTYQILCNSMLVASLLLLQSNVVVLGDNFENLDFEQGFSGESTPGVIPAWRSTVPEMNVYCIDSPCGALIGGPSFSEGATLSGNYSVSLNAHSFNLGGGGAYVRQTGLVPADVRSLQILVGGWTSSEISSNGPYLYYFPAEKGLIVTINDEPISLTQIENLGDGVGIIAGNIAKYAGQDVVLRICATTSNIPGLPQFPFTEPIPDGIPLVDRAYVGGLIDDVTFSPIAVPEPSAITMLCLGSMYLLRRLN
jgi:hypothetical protein